jgi:type II secretory pathway component HofQ
VLVANGETVVLGGIFENDTLDEVSKIPFLGDLADGWKVFPLNFDQKR